MYYIMDKKNENIKSDVMKQIDIYKNGNDKQTTIAKKMEIIIAELQEQHTQQIKVLTEKISGMSLVTSNNNNIKKRLLNK